MNRALEEKIKAVNGDTDRALIMDMHEKLTAQEDKAQEKYDAAMADIQASRELLDELSNQDSGAGID